MSHVVLYAAVLAAAPMPVNAQQGRLGAMPGGQMHAVLEKTFLKIDVLTIDLCFDSVAAARISALIHDNGQPSADSIALAAIESREVLARLRFVRDVGYGQFLDGVTEEQSKAVRAGLLDDSTHIAVRAGLPQWFSFLENRNIRDGDVMVYHITADTVHTTYTDASGNTLMDRVDSGASRRRSVLVTWFAPGSDFRKGLLKSLRKPGAASDACDPALSRSVSAGERNAGIRLALARGRLRRGIR